MAEIYALDFGTSGITMAKYSEEYMKSKTLRDLDGDEIIPAVFVDGPTWDSHIYGKKAKMGQAVYQCISSAKTQVREAEAYTKEGVKYSPEYVISNTVSHAVSDWEESECVSIQNLVLSYPAYMKELEFGVLHRYIEMVEKNTKPGGKKFNVTLTISEPEAAAMAYWNPDKEDQVDFLIDIGGGTTDVCIVEFQTKNGTHYVSARNVYGEILGGDDWDQLIYEFFEKQLIRQGIAYHKDIKLLKELRAKCEEIKINMSTRRDEEVEFYLFSNQNNRYVRLAISKADYHALLIMFWKKLEKLLNHYTSMIDAMQIDNILLVGGTCSNVILQKYLKEYFAQGVYQNVKVIAHKEKTAVAIGAANYAHWVLEAQEDIKLETYPVQEPKVEVEVECSDSLGIKGITSTGEYYIGNVIRKGSTFPCKSTRVFGLFENQKIARLPVYWNESKNWKVKMVDGTYIGEIEVNLSEFQIGENANIEVTISMPSQGIVNVEGNYEGKIRVPGRFKFIRSKGV